MKPYTIQIDIARPRDEVVALFCDPEHLPKWQTGFVAMTPISGEPGKAGSQSLMVYQHGKRKIELTETIVENALPDVFRGEYAWGGGSNTLDVHFTELGPRHTRYAQVCSYQFKSLPLKLMGWIVPGMFRRQSQMYIDQFKAFVEDGTDIRTA